VRLENYYEIIYRKLHHTQQGVECATCIYSSSPKSTVLQCLPNQSINLYFFPVLTHVVVQQKDYEEWRIDRKVYKSANPKKERTDKQYRDYDYYKETPKEKYTN